MNATNNGELKIIPLGGVEEVGINCTVFEYRDRIVVVDMGLGFPDADMYGVDFIVPNVRYLEQNKHKIEGIFITHAHLDHIGALPYLLPRLDFPPVYGSEFTIELIKAKLGDFEMQSKAKLLKISYDSVMESGNFKLRFFRVNHSIPQCLGILIETPVAKVVHTGDFKFDNSPVNEPVADYPRMVEIGNLGIDLMLSDSTNSLKKGYPISETDVAKSLEAIIERARGRVIVAAFAGLVGRLYQLVQIAERHGRKVALAGYSLQQTMQIAQQIGYIRPRPGLMVHQSKVNKFSDEHMLILTTGSQGENNAGLFRMATQEHPNITLKKGDTVIISASTIPGNNVAVQELIDVISGTGAQVYQSADMDLFTSGHGYQEDQKIMLNLIRPHYFMPVHGYQYFLREHGRTAVQVGIKEQNVIIAKRGEIIAGNSQDGFRSTGQLKATPLLVSGSGVGDVGTLVLGERHQLGNHGVVVIGMLIDAATLTLRHKPRVTTKGFVYVKTSSDILGGIAEIAEKAVQKHKQKLQQLPEFNELLVTQVAEFIKKEIGREPMIIPQVNLA